jgi:hypothetical protein
MIPTDGDATSSAISLYVAGSCVRRAGGRDARRRLGNPIDPSQAASSAMRIAIFGLTISSSWGNNHATLWRGLGRALVQLGHEFIFFERNVPRYGSMRDWTSLPPSMGESELVLYSDWSTIEARARRELLTCEAAIVSSYCFDAQAATDTTATTRWPHWT